MKFRIFWIDDSHTWVKSVEEEVIETFSSLSFLPEISYYGEAELARNPILSTYADLIMVDCNLPRNTRGEEFIISLRQHRCFAHVLFYSQDAENLNVLQSDKHFLHVTHRNNIIDTLGEIADQAFRKYRHPAFMRGLLLSEFIDLENLLEELIVKCFREEGEYFRETMLNKGGEAFSFFTKLKFVTELITNAGNKDVDSKNKLDAISFTRNGFERNIIEKRNILAHAYPKYDATTGNISLISPKGGINFDSNWFYETRECIHTYKNKIRDIMQLNLETIIHS